MLSMDLNSSACSSTSSFPLCSPPCLPAFLHACLPNVASMYCSMLPKYCAHVERNPQTLLTRFYGVHRVKPSHGRKVGGRAGLDGVCGHVQ